MTERQRVQEYIKTRIPGNVYVFVDKDSPDRKHKSGWDFFIAWHGREVDHIIFYEAKKTEKREKTQVIKMLSNFQKLTALEIVLKGLNYTIIAFHAEGHTLFELTKEDLI